MTMGSPRPFSGLGFVAGSVRGVRTFRWINRTTDWAELDAPGKLIGLYYPQVWTDGDNLALCRKTDDAFNYYGRKAYADYEDDRVDLEILPPRVFPAIPPRDHMPGCHCGFYAYFDGSNDYYAPDKYGPDLIAGVIEGWGEVLVGVRGFRCTKARIVALNIPHSHPAADLIVAHYPDVARFDQFARMVEAFPEDDGGVREEYRLAREAAAAARAKRKAEEAQAKADATMDDDGGPVI